MLHSVLHFKHFLCQIFGVTLHNISQNLILLQTKVFKVQYPYFGKIKVFILQRVIHRKKSQARL